MNSRRLAAALALALLLGFAFTQEVTVRGELGLDTGVTYTRVAGADSAIVPAVVRVRLELDARLASDIGARVLLLPSFGVGPAGDALRFRFGLQEAHVHLEPGEWRLGAGVERVQLAETRILPVLTLEPRLETGEPRGLPGFSATWFEGTWRASGRVLALFTTDHLPATVGAIGSVRYDSLELTVEGHLLWAGRAALGGTFSTSLDPLVVYGETWVLVDPWQVRGALGTSGYSGDWLLGAEAAWATAEGALDGTAFPALAVHASRPIGFASSLDATVTASWPHFGAGSPQPTLNAAVNLAMSAGDDVLTFSPAVRWSEAALSATLGVGWRSFF